MAAKREQPETVAADQAQEQMAKVKKEIEAILKKTRREGITDLITLMEDSGFYTAPASSGNGKHSAVEGGLAVHSLHVYHTAMKLSQALLGPVARNSAEWKNSVAIVSLLHDLGKCGDHGKLAYVPNILKSGKQSDSKPWERNKELANIPHSIRSVMIAERWLDLTEDEEFAILYHDGLYDRETGGMAVIPGHETKLLMILHWADMWASRILEAQESEEE